MATRQSILVAFLGDLQAAAVDLYLDRHGTDTITPGRKALFQMMGENSVRRRSEDAIGATEQAITGLRTDARKDVHKRFDDLSAQLPDEALAA